MEWDLAASIYWQDVTPGSASTANVVSLDTRITFLETGRLPRTETLSASFDSVQLGSVSGKNAADSTYPSEGPGYQSPIFSAGRGWQLPLETTVNSTRTINYYPAAASLTVRRLPNSSDAFELSFGDEHPRVSPDISEPSSPLPQGASGTILLDPHKQLDLPLLLCRLMDNLHQSTESVILERFMVSEVQGRP